VSERNRHREARTAILARLRQNEREATLPPPWRSRRAFPDLATRFEEALTAAHGEVIRAAGLDGALSALADVLRAVEAQQVVTNATPPLDEIDLPGRFPAMTWHLAGQGDEAWRARCAAADAGLSGVDAALAETGTILVSSGPDRSRLATLLPPIHVALVPAKRLTTDIFTWAAARQGDIPANVTLISGPSKTADIEQTLSVGVHGPKRLIAIVYD